MPSDQNRRPGFLQNAEEKVTLLIVAAIVVVFDGATTFVKCWFWSFGMP